MNIKPIKHLLVLLMILIASAQLAGCSGGSPKESPGENSAAEQTDKDKAVLFAYVGANIKEPVVELAREYEENTGNKVEMTFNNAGALINQLETTERGDIFMPGGITYIQKVQEKGYIADYVSPIAYHTPVIIVPRGNPAKIHNINDLAKPGVKLVLPDKEATAIGRTVYKMFTELGIAGEIENNTLTVVETVPKVITTITMGQGDAGIAEYSNYYKNRDKLDLVEIDPEINAPEQIPCALLTYSNNKELANDFLDFMYKNGPDVFAKYGFQTK
ncbi:molybdate ABC transporter substrate-binding protein [Desulfoscipio gibsoniae]|uniref:Molybdenum ABC transporter, periplasmic molybdate-binding protein n=1 Tax=Desulfoscipio gibsoniae DSM 7213 TaxID=767817 RepID=R4KBB7_9FIRM|nr:molybdate ABC transporter substrate-binding protein [Desulfoscipio gibsoniae]AGK99868.1 molybdenum ABC transporter, periplasmic molybdate-binding protein [Desulfoscipio gibsoniae DSM 7213]